MRFVLSYEYVPNGSCLTFLNLSLKKVGYNRYGWYRCSCGTVKEIRIGHVKSGKICSCGCLTLNIEEYAKRGIDETVAELAKISFVPPESRLSFLYMTGRLQGYNKFALYRCTCGKEKEIKVSHVKTGRIKSCGCLVVELGSRRMPSDLKELLRKCSTTHGLSKHPLFKIYCDIIKRCENQKCAAYQYYGGRGVRMCDEWKRDFKVFFNWAISNKWRPGLQIDKDTIPKRLNRPAILYGPTTCCLISQKENMNAMRSNRNITYLDRTQTLSQWADEYNIPYKLLHGRVTKKWDFEKALTQPNRQRK